MLKNNIKLLSLLALIMFFQSCWAYREISGLLDDAKDLSHDEINALRPLFKELQLQYDYIVSQTPQNVAQNDDKLQQLQYEATVKEFNQQFSNMFPLEATTIYDTAFPSIEEIMGKPDLNVMTGEQQIEFLDMQSILQDTLEGAQININELVVRALLIEENLLKLNKPKIIMFILNALKIGYNAAARVGRAAYCTYSHIPQLNTSLHSLYEGLDCYFYTTSLIVKIQNETYHTIKTIRRNIFDLAAAYKKVSEKNSLMGKIVSLILNVTKISQSISDTIRTGRNALDNVENQLPAATKEVVNCGSNFAVQIPYMIESVANVTECILFVDETKIVYDFMQTEEEYTRQDPQSLEDEDSK